MSEFVKVTVLLNPDGTIHVKGADDPAVREWCDRHDKTLAVGLLGGVLIDPGTALGDDPVIVGPSNAERVRNALGFSADEPPLYFLDSEGKPVEYKP